MKFYRKNKITLYLFLAAILFLFACEQQKMSRQEDFDEVILAKVGDRTISVSEFIKRAEYTPRPQYCRMNYPIHKKIILNSLIAEKLLAIEAGLDKAKIVQNDYIQDYLDGIKEQAMRQILQYNEGFKKVEKIDTVAANKIAYHMSKEYDINYVTISSRDTARLIKKQLKNNPLEELVKKYYKVDSLEQRHVKWHEFENDQIMQALFTKKYDQGDVLGPIKAGNNQYVYIKINGWKGNIAPNTNESYNRRNRAIEYKTQRKADSYYTNFVRKTMAGKEINFNPDVFYDLVDQVAPIYMESLSERRNRLKQVMFKNSEIEMNIKNKMQDMQDLLDKNLFNFAGKNWTVKDFLDYRRSHPLVFRNKKFKNIEFAKNLKMAIVDMMTDYVLTQEAYERGYDEVNLVERHYRMWKDNLIAINQRNKFLIENELDTLFLKDSEKAIKQHLNPYVKKLQQKYSDRIEINKEAFMEIELNRVPMATYKPLAPYPTIVPNFPVITTRHHLDYGNLMTVNQ